MPRAWSSAAGTPSSPGPAGPSAASPTLRRSPTRADGSRLLAAGTATGGSGVAPPGWHGRGPRDWSRGGLGREIPGPLLRGPGRRLVTGERGHQGSGVGRAQAGDRVPAGGRRVTGDGRVGLV